MVSLCNIPCPAFSLIAELLFHSNDSFFFSSTFPPAAQSIKLVLLKVTTPSLEMGLLQESEEARWLNSLTSQAGVEEKQCIRKNKPTSRLGVRQKEGRTEGKIEERGEMREESKRKTERNKYPREKYNWLKNSQPLLDLKGKLFIFLRFPLQMMNGWGGQKPAEGNPVLSPVFTGWFLQGCSLLPYATAHWYNGQHRWQYSRWDLHL